MFLRAVRVPHTALKMQLVDHHLVTMCEKSSSTGLHTLMGHFCLKLLQ